MWSGDELKCEGSGPDSYMHTHEGARCGEDLHILRKIRGARLGNRNPETSLPPPPAGTPDMPTRGEVRSDFPTNMLFSPPPTLLFQAAQQVQIGSAVIDTLADYWGGPVLAEMCGEALHFGARPTPELGKGGAKSLIPRRLPKRV